MGRQGFSLFPFVFLFSVRVLRFLWWLVSGEPEMGMLLGIGELVEVGWQWAVSVVMMLLWAEASNDPV